MDLQPHESPVRRGALLYNIFDSCNEGTATGVEEMFMHAGLYDDPTGSLGNDGSWRRDRGIDARPVTHTKTTLLSPFGDE